MAITGPVRYLLDTNICIYIVGNPWRCANGWHAIHSRSSPCPSSPWANCVLGLKMPGRERALPPSNSWADDCRTHCHRPPQSTFGDIRATLQNRGC